MLKERLSNVREKSKVPVKSTKKVGKAKADKASPAVTVKPNDKAAPAVSEGRRAAKEQSKAEASGQEVDASPVTAVLDEIRKERQRNSRLTSLIVDAAQK